MFELKLNEKIAAKWGGNAPDESALIEEFVAAHNFHEEQTRVSHFKLEWSWVQAVLRSDQTLETLPICVTKRAHAVGPLYMMGVFFSAVRGEQTNIAKVKPVTFSQLKHKMGTQDGALEGGLIPVRATGTWMKKPTAGYFATGKTISGMMTKPQRILLFG